MRVTPFNVMPLSLQSPHMWRNVGALPGALLEVLWERGREDRKSPPVPSLAGVMVKYPDLSKFHGLISQMRVIRSPKPLRMVGNCVLSLAKDLASREALN